MQETTNAQTAQPVKDVYALVTERIVAQLEKGIVPWRKPWTDAGMPRNLVSGKAYRGLNLILLSMLGYEQNLFLTFKQVNDLGGKVKRDEQGHMVTFWKQPEKKEAGEEVVEDAERRKSILRYYMVFNISQCELPDKYQLPEIEPMANLASEAVYEDMPNKPAIRFKEQQAYYNPLQDFINMPKQKSFESNDAYYATLFHELMHSTGHYSRCNRRDLIEMSEFGSDAYSNEELTAEIGACYLAQLTGISSQFEQSAAYIQNWILKLKFDKRLIFTAAGNAQKGVDYILGIQADTDESKTD